MSVTTGEPWRHGHVRANGIRFHYVEAGDGPLVLLLHGFPEFWYSWRAQIPALAARFRVVAPDLRGYGDTDKPAGGYDVRTLGADAAALVEALGETRAAVVGHDWGGAVAWQAAAARPDVFRALAILNAPHPAAMRRELTTNPRQMLRSWYILAFQIPFLPELALRAGGCRPLFARIRAGMARPGHFGPEEVERYAAAFRAPGVAESALAYYRAAFRDMLRGGGGGAARVSVPTLVIWGARDRFLGRELNDGLGRWVPDLRVEVLPGASHWVQQDDPDAVNRLLLEFL